MVDVVTGDIIYSGGGGWAIIGADATLKSWTVMPEAGYTVTTYDGVESQVIHGTGGGGFWSAGGLGEAVMGPGEKLWVTGINFQGYGGALFVEYPRHDDVSDATGVPLLVDPDQPFFRANAFLYDPQRECYWLLADRQDGAFNFYKVASDGTSSERYHLVYNSAYISLAYMEGCSAQLSHDGSSFLFGAYPGDGDGAFLKVDLDSLVLNQDNEVSLVATYGQLQPGLPSGWPLSDPLAIGIDSRGYYWVGGQMSGYVWLLDDSLNLVEMHSSDSAGWAVWPHFAVAWLFGPTTGYCMTSDGAGQALSRFTPNSLSDLFSAGAFYGDDTNEGSTPTNLSWNHIGGLLSFARVSPVPNIAASLGSRLTRFT